MPVSANLDKLLLKNYEEHDLVELADAPVEAIAGISKADEEALLKAFNIKTVRDLGTNKYFKAAAAIVALADSSQKGH
ncbi:hypothetical protein ABTZ46_24210 [Nocardioides sp. NPDC126508]